MTDRFPLIYNISAGQIQELTIDDNIDLTDSGIVNATSIGATSLNITAVATASTLGVNTTSSPTNLFVEGNAASNVVGLGTTDTNTALDLNQGNNFTLTLAGSIVLLNPINTTVGQSGIIQIFQSTGSHTVGFGSHWDFPSSTVPTLSTGAGALDCITYFVRSSTSIITNSLIGIGTL